jgi:hypothetical protein
MKIKEKVKATLKEYMGETSSIAHITSIDQIRLIAILPNSFQVLSTEQVPYPYLGNCSGKSV